MKNISNPRAVIAVYPGRFQPMGIHHKITYDWMVSAFGYDNSFIATSAKVEMPKSPLTYDEKLLVASAHGVPQDKFILCRSPYQPKELLDKLQNERGLFLDDIVIVFVVGSKDMSTNPRFRVGYTKSGRPTYYQHYDPAANLMPASVHGYLVVAPHVDYKLPGGLESSGTNLRQLLSTADQKTFEGAMGFYNPGLDSLFKERFLSVVQETKERNELVLGTQQYAEYIDDLINDIIHVKRSLRSRKNRNARKEAARLQAAVDSLRYLGRKNERQLNAVSVNESIIEKEEEQLTRDEIKSYFDRLKS